LELPLKVARVEEKLAQTHQRRQVLEAKGQDSHVEQRLIRHLSTAVVGLRADQAAYQAVLEQASQAVHPFAIADSRPQSSAQVEGALHQAVVTLNARRARHTARDNQGPAAKFTRQIPGLAALIDAWWLRVEQGLMPPGLDADTQDWLQQQLLPAVYWQVQLEKTKTPNLRTAYQRAFKQAQIALRQHLLSATLTPAEWVQWQAWATELVRQFQRASSAVEGRNGYLSQLNHCARGTPTQRLRVMTVIHNFDLKRADGTTPAERLFGTQFPDLFDWVMERVGALPMPRRAKPRPKPNLLNLQSVPP
jgi:hypothetical protein